MKKVYSITVVIMFFEFYEIYELIILYKKKMMAVLLCQNHLLNAVVKIYCQIWRCKTFLL